MTTCIKQWVLQPGYKLSYKIAWGWRHDQRNVTKMITSQVACLLQMFQDLLWSISICKWVQYVNSYLGDVQKLAHTSMTSRTLWPSATSNHGGLRPRIGGTVTSMMLWPPATTNCGGLRPQNSVYDFRKRYKKCELVFEQPLKATK